MTTIYTIGHSRHAPGHFTWLLHSHAIARLVDVRSHPVSRWALHFDKVALAQLLEMQPIDYVYLGRQLGGRPEGRTFYREDGSVDYALRAAAPDFVSGVEQLVELARDRRTVVLCAEENPARCHRRLLIAPVLARFDVTIVHVRGDGSLESECDLAPMATQQLDLFGERR